MVKIKSSSAIAKSYTDSISRVPGRYTEGVAGVDDWQGPALAGQDNYEKRMQDPRVLARRADKIRNVSTDEWKRKTQDLGAKRIGSGMQANADKRTRNYEPIRVAIEGASLPARTTDANTNIDNRVKGIVAVMKSAAGKE